MYPRFVKTPVIIKVVGLGGGGCNALNHMVRDQISGVEAIAMNTDLQHLSTTEVSLRIALGESITHGQGAGGDDKTGRRSAEDSLDAIKEALKGADMVFLTAGMGGGTGTGAIPVVADIARENGALTLAIVTRPFSFEGPRRLQTAEEGISRLASRVDTLIVIPNDRVIETSDPGINFEQAFTRVDQILCQAVRTVVEMITVPGIINLNFSNIRAVMQDAGPALISLGRGYGRDRATNAAAEALHSPLVHMPLGTARKVLFRIAGGGNLTPFQVNDAAMMIRKEVHPDADVVFGILLDPNLVDETRITLIITGFDQTNTPFRPRPDRVATPLTNRFYPLYRPNR